MKVLDVEGAPAGWTETDDCLVGAAAGACGLDAAAGGGAAVGAGAGAGAEGFDPPMFKLMVGGGGGASVCTGRSIGGGGGADGGACCIGTPKPFPGTNSKAPALSLLIIDDFRRV